MTTARPSPCLARILRICIIAIAMTVNGACFNAALAHSFNMFMVLPETGVDDRIRRDMMQAFLLASEERDSHPNEESNGHLGGLDVYITFGTAKWTTTAVDPGIITTPLAGADLQNIGGEVLIGVPDLDSKAARALLATPANPSMAPFAARFRAATGHAPGTQAKAVYVTARLLSDAVRTAGGVDDSALLRRLLSQ